MNTFFEILKIQQELLSNLVNTWDPKVKQKLADLDELFKRFEHGQETHFDQNMNNEDAK